MTPAPSVAVSAPEDVNWLNKLSASEVAIPDAPAEETNPDFTKLSFETNAYATTPRISRPGISAACRRPIRALGAPVPSKYASPRMMRTTPRAATTMPGGTDVPFAVVLITMSAAFFPSPGIVVWALAHAIIEPATATMPPAIASAAGRFPERPFEAGEAETSSDVAAEGPEGGVVAGAGAPGGGGEPGAAGGAVGVVGAAALWAAGLVSIAGLSASGFITQYGSPFGISVEKGSGSTRGRAAGAAGVGAGVAAGACGAAAEDCGAPGGAEGGAEGAAGADAGEGMFEGPSPAVPDRPPAFGIDRAWASSSPSAYFTFFGGSSFLAEVAGERGVKTGLVIAPASTSTGFPQCVHLMT